MHALPSVPPTSSAAGQRRVEKRNHYPYLQNWPMPRDDTEDQEPEEMESTEDMNDLSLMEYSAGIQQAKGGVAYVRWGRDDCPAGAHLVYKGRAAGSHFSHRGGGANYQCITLEPDNFDFGPGTASNAFMYGAEYEVSGNVPKSSLRLNEHDVPCAVCYAPARSAKIMIPGTYKCPAGWTEEYYGFLMTAHHGHHRSTFECMDKDAETAISGRPNHNGALFYFVEPRCGAMPCPPYEEEKEMTCVVCTF